jgi:hypothetical protein
MVAVTIAVTVAGPTLIACSSTAPKPAAALKPAADAASVAYGSLPSYLPSSAISPDSVLTGDASHPALTTEGDVVDVRTTGFAVHAIVSGPVVPGEGLPYQASATTCTWTVTLSDATAAVPLSLDDFSTIDHLGAVYQPALVAGEPTPSALLNPGQTVTLTLRAVMPTGEGLMRWAPDGQHVVASWDFEVEND